VVRHKTQARDTYWEIGGSLHRHALFTEHLSFSVSLHSSTSACQGLNESNPSPTPSSPLSLQRPCLPSVSANTVLITVCVCAHEIPQYHHLHSLVIMLYISRHPFWAEAGGLGVHPCRLICKGTSCSGVCVRLSVYQTFNDQEDNLIHEIRVNTMLRGSKLSCRLMTLPLGLMGNISWLSVKAGIQITDSRGKTSCPMHKSWFESRWMYKSYVV